MLPTRRRLAGLVLLLPLSAAAADSPRITDPRLVIELVAREPEIVTPTGIGVDERGRVWVVENNTHERPQSYRGPASDRIRIFSDFDANGRARQVRTFAEGFKNGMSLALGKGGAVYFATRSEIYLLRDTDGDDKAAERRIIVKLDSAGNYPHNGLSGFAIDPLDNLYFSLGENLGAAYKLIGSDGATLTGGGEGGSIYRCRADGSRLVRVATGFWNTFHVHVDVFGRLFAVDNDPDSRGPCRLLHIVPGGDYGYRYRNGRKGLHPFTAWNGELPGTLPMLAGTGEAPCGVVAYESNGLPADYRGDLLVTSWGDHVVERFTLVPEGASFRARAQTLVRGGEDFRPVGIVTAPDGSVYLSDWVDKSYPVHGKGRIWRIRMKKPPADDGLRASRLATLDVGKLGELLHHPKKEIATAAGAALAKKGGTGKEVLAATLARAADPRARVQTLWAADRLPAADAVELLTRGLDDPAPEVRGEAVGLLGERLAQEQDLRDESRLLQCALKDASPYVRMRALGSLGNPSSLKAIVPLLADKDPFLSGTALDRLGRPGNADLLLPHRDAADPRLRVGVLLALRRTGDTQGRAVVPKFLDDPDPAVRRAAIQWVGEERLREFGPLLKASVARSPTTRELFEAYLATNAFLAGGLHWADEPSGENLIVKILHDAGQPPAIQALALRMLRPDHPSLTVARLDEFLKSKDSALRREAARTLALRSDASAQDLLKRLAADRTAEMPLRADAVLGLAHSAAASTSSRQHLLGLLTVPELRRDVLRSLRQAGQEPDVERAVAGWWQGSAADKTLAPADRRELAAQALLVLRAGKHSPRQPLATAAGPRPVNEAEWREVLATGGDPAVGERVFFHPNGARCFTCHRVDGRGGNIGPDLSKIGGSLTRDRLIESILTPSKEIAPQFVAWSVVTRDGKVRTGVVVEEGPNSTFTLADAQGKLEVLRRQDIEERHALATSIMPDNLADLMTPQEFRDLITFLAERK